ncbi:MAG: alanine racemase, partial [Planctomycetaceae bacterium]|nr:alanine racemase [Planctomycetaceae bacterium]
MQSNGYVPPSITKNQNGFFETQTAASSDFSNEQIEGVLVEDLVEKFGSPLFVFSERALRDKYHDAYTAFSTRYPDVQFAWSYKTNYLKAICKVFHEEGSIAEVVSDFEYEKARALEIPGHQIIVNGPYKSEKFLRLAVNENAKIQVDNHEEISILEKIGEEIGRPIDIAIRVNMVTGCEPAWTKFGFNFESGDAMLAVTRACSSEHLRLVGLHSHIGTFILDPNQYRVSMQNLSALVWGAYSQFGVEIKYINAGGGFASANTLHYQYLPGKDIVPSFNQYAEA